MAGSCHWITVPGRPGRMGIKMYPSSPWPPPKTGSTAGRARFHRRLLGRYESTVDPYITNGWTQHTWGEAIGDYMKTSQSAYGNTDGSTSFYNLTRLQIRLLVMIWQTIIWLRSRRDIWQKAFLRSQGIYGNRLL